MKRILASSAILLALALLAPVKADAFGNPFIYDQAAETTIGGNPEPAPVVQASASAGQSSSASADFSSCSNLTTEGVPGIVSCTIAFFNAAIYLIMAFSVLYVIWGASKLMREEGRDEGKNIVLYGIAGLFVMVSVWGLVNILASTFNLKNDPITPKPLTAPTFTK